MLGEMWHYRFIIQTPNSIFQIEELTIPQSGVRKWKALYILCRVQPGLLGPRDCSPAQSLGDSEMHVLPGAL